MRLLLAAVLTGLVAATAGCHQPPAPSGHPGPSPSSPARVSSPSAGPSASATGLTAALLTAAELPGLTASYRWREVATVDHESPRLFGTCQRFPLTSLGATDVAVRTYRATTGGAGRAAARELVARFPDAATATRGYAVLTSWRGRCRSELRRYPTRRVGDLRGVSVTAADQAGWYLLTYGPRGPGGTRGSRFLDAQAMLRAGSVLVLVRERTVGAGYHYPAGREPIVRALRAAAAELGQ